MEYIKTAAEILTALAAVAGVLIAGFGINDWKKQLKGKTNYELARRYLRAVYRLRDAIKFVRNPWIPPEETASALKEREGSDLDDLDGSLETRAVYSSRWNKIIEAGSDLDLELREAEISWGQEALDVEKNLEISVKKLYVNLKILIERLFMIRGRMIRLPRSSRRLLKRLRIT
jgi:hypothetical protein